jgi:hypothetical protein
MIKNYKNWLFEKATSDLNRKQTIWCNIWLGDRWKAVDSNRDTLIEVRGDVTIKNSQTFSLPVKFADHRSNFTIERCQNLGTLKGCPESSEEFRLKDCPNIQTLEGGPKEVREYHVQNLGIKNLIGSPEIVTKVFNCGNNNLLESFEGAPSKIEGESIFFAQHCPNVKTILGAPIAKAYFITTEWIENATEKEWLSDPDQNLDLIHKWLNSKLTIEEFLIEKRGIITGKKYGL